MIFPEELEALGDELVADSDTSYLDGVGVPTKEPGIEATASTSVSIDVEKVFSF